MKRIHKVCGGTIQDLFQGGTVVGETCAKCRARWSVQQLQGMPWRQKSTLFETVYEDTVAPPSEPRYKLEEVTEGRDRFYRLRKL